MKNYTYFCDDDRSAIMEIYLVLEFLGFEDDDVEFGIAVDSEGEVIQDKVATYFSDNMTKEKYKLYTYLRNKMRWHMCNLLQANGYGEKVEKYTKKKGLIQYRAHYMSEMLDLGVPQLLSREEALELYAEWAKEDIPYMELQVLEDRSYILTVNDVNLRKFRQEGFQLCMSSIDVDLQSSFFESGYEEIMEDDEQRYRFYIPAKK